VEPGPRAKFVVFCCYRKPYWRMCAKESLALARLARDAGNDATLLFHCHIAAEKTLRGVTTEKTGNPYPKVHSLALADPSASPARRQAIAGHQAEEYRQCLCLILANELKVARR
jgi:hypothetical protein